MSDLDTKVQELLEFIENLSYTSDCAIEALEIDDPIIQEML